MDISKILFDLRQQRGQLEDAINSLERLAVGRSQETSATANTIPKKRGRPPGSKSKKASLPMKTIAAST